MLEIIDEYERGYMDYKSGLERDTEGSEDYQRGYDDAAAES